MGNSPWPQPAEEEDERKIEDDGRIGELQTALFAGLDGSIDRLCLPRRRAESSTAGATQESGAAEPGLRVAAR